MKQPTAAAKIAAVSFTMIAAVLVFADRRQPTEEERQNVSTREERLQAITACRVQLLQKSHHTIETCAGCYDVKTYNETLNIFVTAKSINGDKAPALCIYDRQSRRIKRLSWQ